MKYVKLLILVAIVAIVIVGIILIPDIGAKKVDPRTDPTFKNLSAKIETRWGDNATWENDDFLDLVDMIKQNEKKMPTGGYESLRDQNALHGVGALHRSMMAEFSKSDCRQDAVKGMYENLQAIKADPGNDIINSDSKANECEDTYRLYVKILEFGKKQHTLQPNFNIQTGRFNDFEAHRQKVIRERDALKRNTGYSNISDITDIQTALNVEPKLAAARNKYPSQVASAIKSKFNGLDYTEDNLALLLKAVNNYRQEFNGDKALNQYYLNFKEEVNKRKTANVIPN